MASGTESYYSLDHGDLHLICLNSYQEDRSAQGPMLSWLRQDLAATRQNWIIAFWHHPPYGFGSHNSDYEIELIEMRQNAVPILEAYGADLILCGHSHSYERSKLLHGHHGFSGSLTPEMIRDPGDGRPDGTGVYVKSATGSGAPVGAVYAVAGSAAQVGGTPRGHPAMFLSLGNFGSMVLDVATNRLLALFLRGTAEIDDYFIIAKGAQPYRPVILYSPLSRTLTVKPSGPLDRWGWRRPLPQGNALVSVAYGNGVYVAVGSRGAVLNSPDGMDWRVRSAGHTDLTQVVFGAGLFVVVGENGRILTSPNGAIWTRRALDTRASLGAVAYGNGVFVVSMAGRRVLVSTNGLEWQTHASGLTNEMYRLAYGQGRFVALVDRFVVDNSPLYGTAAVSTNGIAWTQDWIRPEWSGVLTSLAFANDRFIAVGLGQSFGSPPVVASPDGVGWEAGQLIYYMTGGGGRPGRHETPGRGSAQASVPQKPLCRNRPSGAASANLHRRIETENRLTKLALSEGYCRGILVVP